MTDKSFLKHYHIAGVLQVSIDYQKRASELCKLLEVSKAESVSSSPNQIVLCAKRSEVSGSGSQHSGSYKGIKWSVSVQKNSNGRTVYFWSSCFTSFLALRVIVIPLLKESLFQNSGFEFTASAFEYQGKKFVVNGVPGSGKTNTMLKALEKEASFIGDDEIAVLSTREVRSVFQDLELRYDTLKDTEFWVKLAGSIKFKLIVNRLIAGLTGGKISFNVVVKPEELKIKTAHALNRADVFLFLQTSGRVERISAEKAVNEILDQEKNYLALYGDIFKISELLVNKKQTILSLLASCSFWSAPKNTPIDQLLTLA